MPTTTLTPEFRSQAKEALVRWQRALLDEMIGGYERALEAGRAMKPEEWLPHAASYAYNRNFNPKTITLGFFHWSAIVELPRNWRVMARRWIVENEAMTC